MTHVVDTSAVLAALMNERGGDTVFLPGRCLHLSVVNLAELYTKIVERGGTTQDVDSYLDSKPVRVRAFRGAHAVDVAMLRTRTKRQGFSFGDRACLALALAIDLPVLTAETKWAELDLGIDIRLIR